jgi:predicted kinase
LGRSGLMPDEILSILGLVRHHHDPKKLVLRSAGRNRYARLARAINHRLLYLLEQCDLRGRTCSDLEGQLEILELFRIESENFGLWDCPDPYLEWRDRIASEVSESEGREYVVGESIREYELGKIQSPEEAIAKTWEHRRDHGVVTLMCAPPGAGKSSWIMNHLPPDSTIISLDRIREELTGKRSDQSKNGQVLQAAREQLREALRAKRNAVWDATSLRRDGRAVVLGLAHNYHAATRIVTLGVAPETARKQNRNRENQIPQSVVSKLYARWQWPEVWEAHQVDVIYP